MHLPNFSGSSSLYHRSVFFFAFMTAFDTLMTLENEKHVLVATMIISVPLVTGIYSTVRLCRKNEYDYAVTSIVELDKKEKDDNHISKML